MTSKFERKFGKYAIKNLSLYLIIGYVIGYMIYYINPDIYGYLSFNPYMISHGQIWRIFTWMLMPPEELGIFTIIMLILYYQLGQGLEHTWGTYRYNVYMFSGFLFTILSALILYIVYGLLYAQGISEAYQVLGMTIGNYVSTYYINMSIFLAYAFTYPEERLMLYFLIPIKIKWFGIIYGAYILFEIIMAFRYYSLVQAVIITVLIFASLLNFLLYMLLGKNSNRFQPNQVKRRHQYKQSVRNSRPVQYENGARHKCAVCGRTELDDPNLTFRYCSKCSGNKEYCQEHLFTHTHN
ncbi:MAG: hypothetical protein ACLRZ9_04830 [Eubacterium sp.]